MNKPDNAKERNLVKGALRRVFSRSELRHKALSLASIGDYHHPGRPRVTKWGKCSNCQNMEPLYLMQVDHIDPIIPVKNTLEEMNWDEVIERMWCTVENLAVVCKPCHQLKTKTENKERRRLKKERKS